MSSFVVEAGLARPPIWRAPRGGAVRAILAATAVAGAVVATMPVPARLVAAGPTPVVTRAPFLTDLTTTSVLVDLGTDTSGSGTTAPQVSYGLYPGCGGATVAATGGASYSSGGASPEYRWKAQLTGLASDQDYCYTVSQNGTNLISQINANYAAKLPAGGFSTKFHSIPPSSAASFNFTVIGDFGGGTPDEAKVLQQMAATNPRFVVTVGDNVYNSGNEGEYGDLAPTPTGVGNLFAPQYWPQLGGGVPAFFAQGNHGFSGSTPLFNNIPQDTTVSNSSGKYGPDSFAATNTPQLKDNGGNYGSDYYAFTYGNARFYVLHSAWTDGDTAAVCPAASTDPSGGPYCGDYINHWQTTSPEYMWLKADMESHPTALKFAFFHYPLWADGGGQSSDPYTNSGGPAGSSSLENLLASHGVDIVFNGHDHAYERNNPMVSGSPMVSYVTGGGGDTILAGNSCSAPYCAAAAPSWSFLSVSVNGGSVTVTPTDENGAAFDTVPPYSFSGGLVTGTVAATPNGTGIAGATVTCSCSGTPVVTDASGTYFLSTAPGSVTVTASAPGYGSGPSQGATVSNGQTSSVNLTLGTPPPNTVVGRVTDQNTKLPLANTTVTLDSGAPSNATDSNGRYALTSSTSGAHAVNVSRTNYASQSASTSLGVSVATRDFTLVPAGSISGTVSDSRTHSPVAGATVTIGGNPQPPVTTKIDGTYVFQNVPTGTWQVSASAGEYTSPPPVSVSVTAGSTPTANIALTPLATTGYISGSVTDAVNGITLDGASISCSCGVSAVADFNGNYNMAVAQGNYTLTATAPAPYNAQSAPVSVTAGQTTQKNFALTRSQPGGTGGGVQGTHISGSGYWLVASDGGIFPFGSAGGYGSTGGIHLNQPIVGMARTPNAGGYWLVATDGGIFPFGNAGGYGSTGGIHLNQPIVAMAPTPSGHGYWLVASDGGIFPFGDAGGYGSTGGIHLNQPIVGMAPTPGGHGYWLVATDGGIFPFGDAGGYGSTGGIHLNQPIVAMAPSPSGHGYWLAASDGGIFPFGDAAGYGSTGGIHLNQPIVGMTSTPDGGGYWLVATDGGIFPFGNAGGFGSTGGIHLNRPIVGMAVS